MTKPITKWLFDNDGVNIDSEDVAMRVMDDWGVDFISKYEPSKLPEKDHIYKTYPGTSTDKIVEALIKKFDLPLPLIRQDYNIPDTTPDADVPKLLALDVTAQTNQRFQVELKSIAGATQSHEELRAVYGADNIALCTTSPEDRMDISLECAVDPVTGANARLAEFFPKGDHRRSGYKHPNKYDEAFAALGWDPAETGIVEDSKSGVEKAKANRPEVRVIGTVAARFFEDKAAQAKVLTDAGASLVITNFADLPKAAAWLQDNMNPLSRPSFAGDVYVPSDVSSPERKPAVYKPKV